MAFNQHQPLRRYPSYFANPSYCPPERPIFNERTHHCLTPNQQERVNASLSQPPRIRPSYSAPNSSQCPPELPFFNQRTYHCLSRPPRNYYAPQQPSMQYNQSYTQTHIPVAPRKNKFMAPIMPSYQYPPINEQNFISQNKNRNRKSVQFAETPSYHYFTPLSVEEQENKYNEEEQQEQQQQYHTPMEIEEPEQQNNFSSPYYSQPIGPLRNVPQKVIEYQQMLRERNQNQNPRKFF